MKKIILFVVVIFINSVCYGITAKQAAILTDTYYNRRVTAKIESCYTAIKQAANRGARFCTIYVEKDKSYLVLLSLQWSGFNVTVDMAHPGYNIFRVSW